MLHLTQEVTSIMRLHASINQRLPKPRTNTHTPHPRDPRKAAKDPLWRVVFYADKADAKSFWKKK